MGYLSTVPGFRVADQWFLESIGVLDSFVVCRELSFYGNTPRSDSQVVDPREPNIYFSISISLSIYLSISISIFMSVPYIYIHRYVLTCIHIFRHRTSLKSLSRSSAGPELPKSRLKGRSSMLSRALGVWGFGV